MIIRIAKQEDYQNIYDLVKEAFKTANVSDGTEQDFVLQLRQSNNFIPELEFVAEDKSGLIGHIMMTKQVVKTADSEFIGVLVAPLCVKQVYRNQKIGSALMAYASKKAVEMGYSAAFLVGDPQYYGRFGYQETSSFEIENITEIPNQYVLGCELVEDSLANIKGTIAVV